MSEQEAKWNDSKKTPLTKDQDRAFSWIIRILKKKPAELTDHEKEIQKIYKKIIIF